MELPEDLRPEELNDTLRAIADCEALGVDVVRKLIDAFGGTELYIPQGPIDSTHRLVRRLGPEHAVALCELFGLEKIEVPVGRNILCGRRRADIIRLARAGEPYWRIAEKTECSVRNVRYVLAHAREEGVDLDRNLRFPFAK